MSSLKITSVRIENFRKFKQPLELSFVGPAGAPLDYVVLAGPNGCGKTTVLEAILIGLGRWDQVRQDLEAGEGSGSRLDLVAPSTRIELGLQETGATRTRYLARLHGDEVDVLKFRDAPEPLTEVLGGMFPAALRATLDAVYVSSRRRPHLAGPIQPALDGAVPANTESNRLLLLKHRVLQQQSRRSLPRYKGPEPLDTVWLGRLNTFWRAFRSDGSELRLDITDPENYDRTAWDLYLFQGEERICPVDALSSGEQEVLAMAAPFVTQEFDGLLLIDEPELHLHPQWQGRIMPALRALCPHAQIIVATHADDPWDDAYSFQRFLLVPDDDPRSPRWQAAHAADGEE